MKRCTKCGELKPESEFHKFRYGKDGLRSICKKCNSETANKWKIEHKDRVREYYIERYRKNKEKLKTLAARELEEKRKFFKRDVLGGYVITVLNYNRKGEHKYNISNTIGETFKTNDKAQFLNKITELING